MAKTLQEQLAALSPERQQRVAALTAQLVAEETSLRDLRHAMALTQAHMAEVMGVSQGSISRLEQRSDLLLSTLMGYVHALGGELHLVAEFPDRPPVLLKGLADLAPFTPRQAAAKPVAHG